MDAACSLAGNEAKASLSKGAHPVWCAEHRLRGADKLFCARQGPEQHSPEQPRALGDTQGRAVQAGLPAPTLRVIFSSLHNYLTSVSMTVTTLDP
ncbi:hypothetical protein MC885_013440 [Smutsia gigantea]|nr:hypothetical protein MC885_013440 [Smutsia gigantea]